MKKMQRQATECNKVLLTKISDKPIIQRKQFYFETGSR